MYFTVKSYLIMNASLRSNFLLELQIWKLIIIILIIWSRSSGVKCRKQEFCMLSDCGWVPPSTPSLKQKQYVVLRRKY